MQHLEVSAAVRHIYMSLGFKRLKTNFEPENELRKVETCSSLWKWNYILKDFDRNRKDLKFLIKNCEKVTSRLKSLLATVLRQLWVSPRFLSSSYHELLPHVLKLPAADIIQRVRTHSHSLNATLVKAYCDIISFPCSIACVRAQTCSKTWDGLR